MIAEISPSFSGALKTAGGLRSTAVVVVDQLLSTWHSGINHGPATTWTAALFFVSFFLGGARSALGSGTTRLTVHHVHHRADGVFHRQLFGAGRGTNQAQRHVSDPMARWMVSG